MTELDDERPLRVAENLVELVKAQAEEARRLRRKLDDVYGRLVGLQGEVRLLVRHPEGLDPATYPLIAEVVQQ